MAKEGNAWRLRLQFQGHGLVPGVDAVVSASRRHRALALARCSGAPTWELVTATTTSVR